MLIYTSLRFQNPNLVFFFNLPFSPFDLLKQSRNGKEGHPLTLVAGLFEYIRKCISKSDQVLLVERNLAFFLCDKLYLTLK